MVFEATDKCFPVKKFIFFVSHPGIGFVCTNATFFTIDSVEVYPPGFVNITSQASIYSDT